MSIPPDRGSPMISFSRTSLGAMIIGFAILFATGCSGLFADLDDLSDEADDPDNGNANPDDNRANTGPDVNNGISSNTGECENTAFNDLHCGSCDNACDYIEFCVDGQCQAPHFEFQDQSGQGSWFGGHFALVVDGDHTPHIAYEHEDSLMYRWQTDGGSWSSESIASLDSDPNWLSLVFDGDQNLHLTYIDGIRLSYAARENGSWDSHRHISDDTSISAPIIHHSMVIDSQDTLHAVVGTNAGDIEHLAYDGHQWTHQSINRIIEVPNPGAPQTAIGVDDVLHTTFTITSPWEIFHAQFDQQWSYDSISSDYAVSSRHRVAVDDTGAIHLAMIDQQSDQLFYGHRHAGESSSWSIEQVDSGENLSRTIAFAVDSKNRPHIAYYDYDLNDRTEIRYARKTGDDWLTQVIDDAEILQGAHIDLDVDTRGYPHLLYRDGGETLRYTTIN